MPSDDTTARIAEIKTELGFRKISGQTDDAETIIFAYLPWLIATVERLQRERDELRRKLEPPPPPPVEPDPPLAEVVGLYRVGPNAPKTWVDDYVVGVEPDGSTWAARDGEETRTGFWSWDTVAAMARRGEYRKVNGEAAKAAEET